MSGQLLLSDALLVLARKIQRPAGQDVEIVAHGGRHRCEIAIAAAIFLERRIARSLLARHATFVGSGSKLRRSVGDDVVVYQCRILQVVAHLLSLALNVKVTADQHVELSDPSRRTRRCLRRLPDLRLPLLDDFLLHGERFL